MATVKGILSFPQVFTPKLAKGATEPKYGVTVLLAPGDPQIASLQAEVDAAKLNGFPSGYTGQDECLGAYDVKYAGKDYYDPRFTGWWVFSCSAKADDKPAVVDMAHQPIIDPGAIYSGMVGYVSAGISAYIKGKGGIGGWLNGVMLTAEEPPMGRLDGKPSVEQMFAGVTPGAAPAPAQQHVAATGAAITPIAPNAPQAPAPAAPTPPAPPAPPAPPVAAGLVMTATAAGVTYEQYKAQNWTDEQMIAAGVAIKPSFA